MNLQDIYSSIEQLKEKLLKTEYAEHNIIACLNNAPLIAKRRQWQAQLKEYQLLVNQKEV